MKITGLGVLDKAIARHPLTTGSHQSPIQSCCELNVAMDHAQVAQTLKEKSLLPLPYCMSQKIVAYLNQPSHPCDTLYLHQIKLPSGKPLCWALLDKNGMLLEQAHCVPRGRYTQICRRIIRHLINMTPKQLTFAA